MSTTHLIVDRDFIIGPIDPRLYGSFAEHLGRCVYGGLYEPGHPTADAQGFRRDVLDLVRELGVTLVRYPGGNFVSSYRWEDGVGPRDQRPRRLDSAWFSTETNQFGTDDFIDWCRVAQVEPLLTVNLGTRGPTEAADYREYCNHPQGTALSDQRIANGHAQPHRVKLWCLGNEMDGPWQFGSKTAVEYGRICRESAKAMIGPDYHQTRTDLERLEFVACGSSNPTMPSFGTWERQVLEECYDYVHYLSVHFYAQNLTKDLPNFLAQGARLGIFIDQVIATCDAVQAQRRSPKRINLSVDEWNVWYHSSAQDRQRPAWEVAPPLLEDIYDAADALVVGDMLIAMLKRADRVHIGCLAQLVNVIGPIMTRTGGPAWRQTIFHPFALASRYGRGTALRVIMAEGSTYACAAGPAIPCVDAAVMRQDDGGVVAFVINRDVQQTQDLRLELRAFGPLRLVEWTEMHEQDLTLVNDEQHPDRVVPHARQDGKLDDHTLTATLPPASWHLFRLAPA